MYDDEIPEDNTFVSIPFNVHHDIHVDFDSDTGFQVFFFSFFFPPPSFMILTARDTTKQRVFRQSGRRCCVPATSPKIRQSPIRTPSFRVSKHSIIRTTKVEKRQQHRQQRPQNSLKTKLFPSVCFPLELSLSLLNSLSLELSLLNSLLTSLSLEALSLELSHQSRVKTST